MTSTKNEQAVAKYREKRERRAAGLAKARAAGFTEVQIADARYGRRRRVVGGAFADHIIGQATKPGKFNDLIVGTLAEPRELEMDEVDA